MRKSLTALTAATTIAVAAVATSTTADARWRGGWWGPAIGGFALGAIVGSAFARPYYAYPYYGYGYGYPAYGYGYPAYSYGTATAIQRTTATHEALISATHVIGRGPFGRVRLASPGPSFARRVGAFAMRAFGIRPARPARPAWAWSSKPQTSKQATTIAHKAQGKR